MRKKVVFTFLILTFLITNIFIVNSAHAVMPVPTGMQIFPYPAIEVPVLSDNPSEAKPVGVGSVAIGGNTVNIRVGLNQISDYVDVYFAIAVPKITPEVFILTSNYELKPLSEVGLVPWKQNILGPINESLFGDIPLSLLPLGTYYIYLVVTPTGRLDSYYLWITYFRQPPVTITFPYCGDEEINIFEGETCDTYPEAPIYGDSNDLRQCRAPGTIGECTYCGDAIKNTEAGEQCDDGDSINDNDCRNDCTLPKCGDGILDSNEECDDGNNNDGDGCSANCKIENMPPSSPLQAVLCFKHEKNDTMKECSSSSPVHLPVCIKFNVIDEYPDNDTVEISGSGAGTSYNWDPLTYAGSFEFTLRDFQRSPAMCSFYNFYGAFVDNISGYIDISFNYPCQVCDPKCTTYIVTDSIRISDFHFVLNDDSGICSFDCNTDELLYFVPYLDYGFSKYLTENGGYLQVSVFELIASGFTPGPL